MNLECVINKFNSFFGKNYGHGNGQNRTSYKEVKSNSKLEWVSEKVQNHRDSFILTFDRKESNDDHIDFEHVLIRIILPLSAIFNL